MKNPVRSVVIEYKNKRTRKGNVSLWGNIDLKSIAREIEADKSQASIDVAVSRMTEPPHIRAEVNDPNIEQQIVAPTEALAEGGEPALQKVVRPTHAMIARDPRQEPENPAKIEVRQKKAAIRRGVKTRVLQKAKTATHVAETVDIRAELLFLEQENASLRRDLIAKLRVENANLLAMLQQAEQRSATNTR